jgi:site-specific DNA-methyltransferase (adenine-specific)
LTKSAASSNPWFEVFANTRYWELLRELHRVHARNTHCYIFCDSETEHVIMSGRNPYDVTLDAELVAEHRPEPPARAAGWTAWPPLTWVKTKPKSRTVDADALTYADIQPGMGMHWRRADERILFLEQGKRGLAFAGWPSVVLGPRAGPKDFPTMKPREIVRRLIENSSSPGDVVLDPFAGSGIVADIALSLGRRTIAIDLQPSRQLETRLRSGSKGRWPGKKIEWRRFP